AVSASLVVHGQPITLTATVSGSNTTGTVTFTGVASPAPVVPLDTNGVATWTSSSLPVGSYSPSAVYSGDSSSAASSGAASFIVSLPLTQTELAVSAVETPVGQAVTLTATVTGIPGGPTPTGSVAFNGVARPTPVVPLNGSGVAVWTSSTLASDPYG